jgi:hypothetical protein
MHAFSGSDGLGLWVSRGLASASMLLVSEPEDCVAVAPPSPGVPAAPQQQQQQPRAAKPAPHVEGGSGGGGDVSRLRRCQVPGCCSSPAEPRSYAGRCRLCVTHMRADTVELGAQLLRFCQKCVTLGPERRLRRQQLGPHRTQMGRALARALITPLVARAGATGCKRCRSSKAQSTLADRSWRSTTSAVATRVRFRRRAPATPWST